MKIASAAAFLLVAAVGACTSDPGSDDAAPNRPTDGHAVLTIVGDTNLFLETGWRREITVRYHGDDEQPLAGEVAFALVGSGGGASLSAATAVTDADGNAKVTVVAGADGEASFRVAASAPFAQEVAWSIAVKPPVMVGPLDATGLYRVQSQFDLAGDLPGTVGDVIETFLEMTDDPNDPATWVLDRVVDELGSGTIVTLIQHARPFLDGIVNDLLHRIAPDLVDDLLAAGNQLGDAARSFGTVSTLAVTGTAGGDLASTHTITGISLEIDGRHHSWTVEDLGLAAPVATGVAFALDGETRATVGDHELALSYGTILLAGLDEVIVPALDPRAHSLRELLGHQINCDAIGRTIADTIGLGSAGVYIAACSAGLDAAARLVEDRIRDLDGAGIVLGIGGAARVDDPDQDRVVDVLSPGSWTGAVRYAGQPAPLGPSSFRADRMAPR